MRSIYLVRHPATPWSGLRYAGRTDVPLSPAGQRQTAVIAAVLARRVQGWARVVSSPLVRAALAARRIADAGGWPIAYDARWREVDFGAAEGATFGEVARAWPTLAARLARGELTIDWPEGEGWSALHARVGAGWCDLMDDPTDSVIVVTHGGPIAVALQGLGDGCRARRLAPGEILQVAVGQGSKLVWSWKPRR